MTPITTLTKLQAGGLPRRTMIQSGLAAAVIGNLMPQLARAEEQFDIGLVAPFSGPDETVGSRVLDSLKTHKNDDSGNAIYPEFDGKELTIITRDSKSVDTVALSNAQKLHEADGVNWIVSGDIRTRPIKIVEQYCKKEKVDCIQACSRLKLNKSNPHPYSFQILPNWESHVGQMLNFIKAIGLRNDGKVLFLISEGAADFWRQQLPDILNSKVGFVSEVIELDLKSPNSDIDKISRQIAVDRKIPLIFLAPYQQHLTALSDRLEQAPVFIDSFLEDPADNFKNLPNSLEGQVYFNAINTRSIITSSMQKKFYDIISQIYFREPTPIDTLAATALQILGRVAGGTLLNKVNFKAEETVGGLAVQFDDQGANIAARSRIFAVSGGSLLEVNN
jgi:hypothetical protein